MTKIKKVKIGGEFIYPATIAPAVKTTAGKTLEDVLGTNTLVTKAQDVTGAINELKERVDSTGDDAAVKANTEAIATLNGADTVSGSVAKAVKDAKEAIVGDASDKGDTLGEIEDRVETIETLVTQGTDNEVVDNLKEVLTWFAGVSSTDTGAQLVTDVANNKSAIGDAKSGLIKDVADLKAADVVTVDSNSGVKKGSNTYVVTVHTDSTNYVTIEEGAKIKVAVSDIKEKATGLATASAVYDYALTAEDVNLEVNSFTDVWA